VVAIPDRSWWFGRSSTVQDFASRCIARIFRVSRTLYFVTGAQSYSFTAAFGTGTQDARWLTLRRRTRDSGWRNSTETLSAIAGTSAR
jgi:hypothetical protein